MASPITFNPESIAKQVVRGLPNGGILYQELSRRLRGVRGKDDDDVRREFTNWAHTSSSFGDSLTQYIVNISRRFLKRWGGLDEEDVHVEFRRILLEAIYGRFDPLRGVPLSAFIVGYLPRLRDIIGNEAKWKINAQPILNPNSEAEEGEDDFWWENIRDERASPEEEVCAEEFEKQFLAACSARLRETKLLILDAVLDDPSISPKELAKLTGLNPNSAKVEKSQALRVAREEYARIESANRRGSKCEKKFGREERMQARLSQHGACCGSDVEWVADARIYGYEAALVECVQCGWNYFVFKNPKECCGEKLEWKDAPLNDFEGSSAQCRFCRRQYFQLRS